MKGNSKHIKKFVTRNIVAGGNITAFRYITFSDNIYTLLMLRQFATVLAMSSTLSIRETVLELRVASTRVKRLLLLEALLTIAIVVIAYKAMVLLSPSLFPLMENTLVLISSIVLSAWYLKEKISISMMFSISGAVLGLILLITGGDFNIDNYKSSAWGITLVTLSSTLYGVETVVATKLRKDLSASALTCVVVFTRLLLLPIFPFLFGEKVWSIIAGLGWLEWGIIISGACLSLWVAHINFKIMPYLNNSMRQSLNLLIPCVATFLSVPVFNQVLNPYQLVGIGVVVVSLYSLIRCQNEV